jgi:hypothetical protein
MAANDVPVVKPLEGTTTIDDKLSFEPERLSYESAVAIAADIAEKIACLVQGKNVVIAGTDLLADLSNLKASYLILDDLARAFTGLITHATDTASRLVPKKSAVTTATKANIKAIAPAAILAPGAIAATANLALGLVSLFRQDVAYTGRPTHVDDLAFEIALAAKIREKSANSVYVPAFLSLSARPGSAEIQSKLAAVQDARAQVWSAVAPLVSTVVVVEAKLADAVAKKDQPSIDSLTDELTTLRRGLEPLTTPLDRADRRLSDLMMQWNSIDPATGMTMLGKLLRAEGVASLAEVFVHAQVVSSGGFYKTKRNLLRTLFSGDGLSIQGGAVARWAVLSADGAVQVGGVLTKVIVNSYFDG